MKILIVNGPNLNLLGKREPGVYGVQDFNSFLEELKLEFHEHEIRYFQSNSEGLMIDALHNASEETKGIILNAGAYSHTSLALADAIAAIAIPVVEVHISNVHARETFRHSSMIARNCVGQIAGFGLNSYRLAVRSFLL